MRADGRVRSIGYTSDGPIPGGVLRVWLAGDRPDAGKYSEAVYVAGDYFNIVGVRLLRGRALADAEASAPAVVVNEAFVTEFELSEPVLGQTVRIVHPAEKGTSARHVTIIGVVSEPASTAVNTPEDNDPRMYLPLGAVPGEISAWMSADNAAQITDTVRRTLTDLDPELPILAVRTLEEAEAAGSEPLRQIARTAGGLGLVSLLLAVSGLYSVIAFFVALRTREFGIRVALGAQSADIVRMVLAQALRLAGTGLALGTVLGIPLLIVLDKNFGFMQPFDPAVMGTTALVLALTALLAGWVPARRASRIHAAVALRAD
jgi:ABC-type antimicrobial peptide transport system permease subunit